MSNGQPTSALDPNQVIDQSPKTFSEITQKNSSVPMQEKSSFLLLKSLSDSHFSQDAADNDTVLGKNSIGKYHSQRMTIMFTLPKEEDDTEETEATLTAIDKINQMLNLLVNKLPKVRLGPWTATTATIKDKQLLKNLPLKIDVAEQYIYDYNRFISPGQRGYCRL